MNKSFSKTLINHLWKVKSKLVNKLNKRNKFQNKEIKITKKILNKKKGIFHINSHQVLLEYIVLFFITDFHCLKK